MTFIELIQKDYFLFTIGLVFIFLLAGLPIGYLLIHRNLGLFSDAISHSLIPGLVGAVLFLGLSVKSLFIGAFVWGMLVATVFSLLGGLKEKKRDSTLVAISLFGLSLGLILNQIFNLKIDFTHLLFGSPLLADANDLIFLGGFSIFTLLTVLYFWKTILRLCIDPVGSTFRFGQLKSQFIFSSLTTILVVIGFQIFGVLLTTGLLILPHVAFDAFHFSIKTKILVNIFLTTIFAIFSFFLSYNYNLTFSATFVLGISLLALMNRLFKISET
ncbi:MAG TPA: metal ABC transporter permease [Pseudobdellovibrionaceae bacterium]|nr:metal ABC transporter permease [Pseudobdellovibrionaceae bacterium]